MSILPNKGSGPRLAHNYLLLAVGESASKVITLVAIAYVARVAGPTGFGYLEFASSAVLLAGLFVHQGLSLYGAREVARAPSATDRLVAEITLARFLLTIVAFVALLVFVQLVDRPATSERLILIYAVGLLVMPLTLQWVFQGHERMQAVSGIQLIRQLVFALFAFAFFRSQTVLWPAAMAEVAGLAASALTSLWLYRRYFGHRVPFPGGFSMQLLREGAIIGLSRIFWSIRIFGATVVVGLVASEEHLGYFGAAMRILVSLDVFVWLYFINLLPSMVRSWDEGPDRFRAQVERSMRIVGWLGAGAGLVWISGAPLAIALAYGHEYAPATPALKTLALASVISLIHGHFRFGLIAAKRPRDEMISTGLGALVSLPLIPVGYRLWGVTGAAAALVAGELAIWSSSYVASRRWLHTGGGSRHLALPALCACLVGLLASRLMPSQLALLPLVVAGSVLALALLAYSTDTGVRAAARDILGARRNSPSHLSK